MSDNIIITAVTPINVGIIKYFDDPPSSSYYPVHDYITATLDSSVTCAKASVCARKEFTDNEFWLNGKRDANQLSFYLNEIKYQAANQRTVSIEFLSRKVHIAVENNFLPSPGAASFGVGFNAIMTALCRLYKIKHNIVTDGSNFTDIVKPHCDGFAVRRQLISTTKNFKGKLIAEGKHWPDLRVLILVVKNPRKQISTERMSDIVKSSQYLVYRLNESLPSHITAMYKAIKQRDFQTFAETMMIDTNQYHSINTDLYPPRAYKTEVSHKIAEVVHLYNKMALELRIAYVFDHGPNATLFFLEKHAQEIISLIQYVFPSSKPGFIKGLEVPSGITPEKFQNFPIAPMKHNRIKFAVYSKIGNVTVQLDKENHLLDDNGDIKVKSGETSPGDEPIAAAAISDNTDDTGGSPENTMRF